MNVETLDNPVILVDFDDTLVDFQSAFKQFLIDHGVPFPEDYNPKSVHWEEDPKLAEYSEQIDRLFRDYVELGFPGIKQYPGAKDFLDELKKGWDIFYCTSRSGEKVKRETLDYFNRFNFPPGDVIFSRDKDRMAMAMGASIAIDDNSHHARSLLDKGIHVLMPERSHNQDPRVNGAVYFTNYDSAIGILRSIRGFLQQ